MTEALFLNPVFQDRIWGGTKLHDYFGYDIPSDTTGEDWAISAHPNGPSVIKNGEYKGKTLAELWQENPALFGNAKKPFSTINENFGCEYGPFCTSSSK